MPIAHCSRFPNDIRLICSRIKVLAIIAFFIIAICISSGGIGPQTIGFKYWHNPGAFADSINGVARTFVVAGTLYAGTEMYIVPHPSPKRASLTRIGLASLQVNPPIRASPSPVPSSKFSGGSSSSTLA